MSLSDAKKMTIIPRRTKVKEMIIKSMFENIRKTTAKVDKLIPIGSVENPSKNLKLIPIGSVENPSKNLEEEPQESIDLAASRTITTAKVVEKLIPIGSVENPSKNLEEEPQESIDLAASRTIHKNPVLKCKLYLFLFRLDSDFDRDSMVQSWVAHRIFAPEADERMEILAGAIFDSMVETQFVVPSRFDNVYGLFMYRLNRNITAHSNGDYLLVFENQLGGTSKMTKHLSIIYENFDLRTAQVLREFKDLRVLKLICQLPNKINQLPDDLFLYLKHLTTLDLHEFSIYELPSSIRKLESLRYLDVSGSPIKSLPESMDSLYLLETLKLKGCLELQRLPKYTRRLICLRHLDLDVIGQLSSMPKGLGSLTRLQTLGAFPVGKEYGCGITELKNLVNLTGSFCISRLENVWNADEAREAELSKKKYLTKIQLRWGGPHHNGSDAENAILECLQPHFGIKELDILYFNGTKLPTWISDSSFTEIVSISLFQCGNSSMLPSLGMLPSLNFLEIYEMNAVRIIDHSFCGSDGGDQESRAFPKLEKLTLDGMLNLAEWTGVVDRDFPSLLELKLKYCPKLFTLPFLSKLDSLNILEIIECTQLQFSSEDVLPASLETLIVKDCPKLNSVLCNPEERSKIAHVCSFFLDHEEIVQKC